MATSERRPGRGVEGISLVVRLGRTGMDLIALWLSDKITATDGEN